MASDLKLCEKMALKLPLKERAALAEQILSSLDVAMKPSDREETERLWVQEAERRYREYKKGAIPARAAREVLRDARAALG
ncbi:MAG: addiction module protein [Verrucomicrobiia bacterium]